MSEKSETTVIGSLPRSRPARRSDKRAPRAAPNPAAETTVTKQTGTTGRRPPAHADKRTTPAKRSANSSQAAAKVQRAQAQATPPPQQAVEPERAKRINPTPSFPEGTELLGTVVKATAELAEIGLTVGARALRSAVSRLPRP